MEKYAGMELEASPYFLDMSAMRFTAQWELGKFDRAEQTLALVLDNHDVHWDGKILCMQALCLARRDAERDLAFRKFCQALRWFEYRLDFQSEYHRNTVFKLINQCNAMFHTTFQPENNNSWNELTGLRLESTQLVNAATVERGLAKPFVQRPMNNNWGSYWTPITDDPINGSQFFWLVNLKKPVGKRVTITFDARSVAGGAPQPGLRSGACHMTGYLTQSDDYGQFKFWLNGNLIAKKLHSDGVDLYDPGPTSGKAHAAQNGETEFGVVELIEGLNRLEIEIIGKNEESKGFNLGIDFIEFWPVDYIPGKS